MEIGSLLAFSGMVSVTRNKPKTTLEIIRTIT